MEWYCVLHTTVYGTAEGWYAQTGFGQGTVWWPCAHSVDKFIFFFTWFVGFPLKLQNGLSGHASRCPGKHWFDFLKKSADAWPNIQMQ